MEDYNSTIPESLTFDDVLLVPGRSEVHPRDVQLSTRLSNKLQLNIPLLSAAMDTVTEARTAIAIASHGGMGIIHRSLTLEQQAAQVKQVKKARSGMVVDPITVRPEQPLHEATQLMQQHKISGLPVTKDSKLVGILTHRDIRFEEDLSKPIHELMTHENLVTVHEDISAEDSRRLLHRHRIEKLLVVNAAGELKGLITVKDIADSEMHPLACKDDRGRLKVGAAVGVTGDWQERVHALVEAGVDVIAVDTAHGHSRRVLDAVAWIRSQNTPIQIIAGNIATGEAAHDLIQAGADILKVGVGPGSICTTRIVAGVGVPQISAIQSVARVAKPKSIAVIADGGIKYSGDIPKAIAAGADAVMIGSLFAGTEESPGELVLYQGRSYKVYRGMGSLGAMANSKAKDRYMQEDNSASKLVPEGIEGRVPYRGPISEVIYQLTGGLRSSMGYLGCSTIQEVQDRAKLTRISSAGLRESHVHDVIITKEAPNYYRD